MILTNLKKLMRKLEEKEYADDVNSLNNDSK